MQPASADQIEACPLCRNGQESTIEGWPSRPAGFSDRAWNGVQKVVIAASFGARRDGLKTQDGRVGSRTDGLRPTVFLTEPIRQEAST